MDTQHYDLCPNGHGSMKATLIDNEGDPALFDTATKTDYECEICKYSHVVPR